MPATLTPETSPSDSLPGELVNPSTPVLLSSMSESQLDELATTLHTLFSAPTTPIPPLPTQLRLQGNTPLQAIVTLAGRVAAQAEAIHAPNLTPQQLHSSLGALYSSINGLSGRCNPLHPIINTHYTQLGSHITSLRTQPASVPLQDIKDELQALRSSRTLQISLTSDSGKPAFIARTPPIILHTPQDLNFPDHRLPLGPFQIVLSLHSYFNTRSTSNPRGWFYVSALSPVYSTIRHVHPHLTGHSLCIGSEAPGPLKASVHQFRILDALSIIHSVLREYNPRSPYCALESWLPPEPVTPPAPTPTPPPTPVPALDPTLLEQWSTPGFWWSNPVRSTPPPLGNQAEEVPPTPSVTATIPAGSVLVVESVDPTSNSVTLRAEPAPEPALPPLPSGVYIHQTTQGPLRFYATINRPGDSVRLDNIRYVRLVRDPETTTFEWARYGDVHYFRNRADAHNAVLSTPIPISTPTPPATNPAPTTSWDSVIEATRYSRPVPPPVAEPPANLRVGTVRAPSPTGAPHVPERPSQTDGSPPPVSLELLRWINAQWLPESESLAILRDIPEAQFLTLYRTREIDSWQSHDLRTAGHLRNISFAGARIQAPRGSWSRRPSGHFRNRPLSQHNPSLLGTL